jgi:agmatinase
MVTLGDSTGAFLGLGSPFSDFENARFVVIPMPFEASAGGREGAARGAEAVLEASRRVELFDEETFANAARLGIATVEPQITASSTEEMSHLAQELADAVPSNKRAFWVGGEGSISHGLIRSYLGRYRDLSVLQLDAHPNLRTEYLGKLHYGRMTVMNKLQTDLPITQVGIRSMSEEEADLTDKGKVTTIFAQDVMTRPLKAETLPQILENLSEHVYVSVDMTVFDPALCPGVNLPEPGGLGWREVLEILRTVARDRDIVGMDVVETVPLPHQDVTQLVAAKLIYKTMGYLGQFRGWPPLKNA